ncbi:hypothetical protein ACFLQI_01395 [Candidatus Undinarchaeota archaeon]
MVVFCLPANIISVIVGAVLLKVLILGGQNNILLVAFALVTIAAQFLYLTHRGFRPLAGSMSFVILILSLLIFRSSYECISIFSDYLVWFVGIIVLLQIVKLPIG